MAKRIDARPAQEDVDSGALLVCAYDDDAKWRQNRLEGAISLADFRAREGSIPKDREIIFY